MPEHVTPAELAASLQRLLTSQYDRMWIAKDMIARGYFTRDEAAELLRLVDR